MILKKTVEDNAKKINHARDRPQLESTAKYLNMKLDFSSIKKKQDIVSLIIERLATLFLEPCRICKKDYAVAIDDDPLLSCYFCGQGCHDDCYSEAYKEKVMGLFFICLSCEVEELKKKKLSNKKSKVVQDVVTQTHPSVNQSAATDVEHDTVAEALSDASIPREVQNHKNSVSKKPICRFYKKGICKYGLSGKTGGECKYQHPKLCKKYSNFGKFSASGCKDASCDKWHPRICYTGVNTGVCSRRNCPFFHGNLIKRDKVTDGAPVESESREFIPTQAFSVKKSFFRSYT